MIEKQKRLIGLARRAGKVSYGSEGVISDIKRHKAKLVVFASDISERTKNEVIRNLGNLPYMESDLEKEELGRIIGTKPTAVLSVNDSNLKKGILEVSQFD